MRQRGMTLVELLVVMVIVAILGAIAIPSYRNYVIRVNRTEAKAALTSAASFMERCFTRQNSYTGCPTTPVASGGGAPFPQTLPSGKYVVSVAVPAGNRFIASAAPQGAQADDTQCATLTLDQSGLQGVTGGTKPATECW
jgi:type IV pilus assembly protein PilE